MRPVGRYLPPVQQRGSLVIGAGSLVLLSAAVLLAAYFVHVQDAAARARRETQPAQPAPAAGRAEPAPAPKAIAPAAPPATVSAPADMLGKSVEIEFDGKHIARTWADLGVMLDKESGSPVVDRARVEAALLELKTTMDRAPLNARMDLEARKVHRDKPGFGIEIFGAVSAIETAARAQASRIVLEGAPIPATFTVADLG